MQENNFSGAIPTTLFALPNLVRLNLASNGFSSEISPEFNNLPKLRILNLEFNDLTGSIPNLNNLSALRVFNVSFNQLNGSIPQSLARFLNNSFMGNSLCGSPLAACPGIDGSGGGKKLSAGAIAGIVIGSVFGLIVVLVVLFFLLRKTILQTTPPQAETYRAPPEVKAPGSELNSPKPLLVREIGGHGGSKNGDLVVVNGVHSGGRDDGLVFFGEGNVDFGLEEMLRAPAEVLGKGTLGSTYKAYLGGETEVVVVVKRLREICVSERKFREKVEGLGMLVHENLLPFRAYYYGREERLIVFDCMLMGSLSALLQGSKREHRAALTWEIRTKIAFGAAHGIEYLHSLGSNISHGNIKSSNIFLTDFYAACVSEYGLCQLVPPGSTLDQNGYRAPEVTDTRKISQKADVYSFGVLLLELLTGKSPNHGVLNEEGVDLPRWVSSMSVENQMIDVLDKELVRQQNNGEEEQMVELLRVGMHCTSQHPKMRPTMVEVTRLIRKVVI